MLLLKADFFPSLWAICICFFGEYLLSVLMWYLLPLNSKEIQPAHPKGNQPWTFTGRTDAEAEAEASRLWPPDAKSQLTGKDLMLGKIKGRRRRGRQRTRWLDSITDSMDMSLSKLQQWWRTGKPGVLQSMGSKRVRYDSATEQQQY